MPAGHQRRRRQREIGVALDAEFGADLPVKSQTRNGRIMRRDLEVWMIAAQREREIAVVFAALEPTVKSEAASQVTILREEIGVRRQLRLNSQKSIVRLETGLQSQLSFGYRRDIGARVRGRNQARKTQQIHLEMVAERNGQQREGVNDLEG